MTRTAKFLEVPTSRSVFEGVASAFFVPISSGILLGCSFRWSSAFWLVWFGLVPVAFVISSRKHLVAAIAGMYCAGLCFNLITTDWIRTLEGNTGLSGRSAPDWLLQSELLALFWPVTLILGRLLVGFRQLPMCVVLPCVWTIHEQMLRTLWAFVDQTGWQAYFLGYAVVNHYYISQVADLAGVGTLSFLAACSSGAIWDFLSGCLNKNAPQAQKHHGWLGPSVAVTLLLASCAYGAWQINQTPSVAGPCVWLMPEDVLHQSSGEIPWQPATSSTPDVLLWSERAYEGPPIPSSEITSSSRLLQIQQRDPSPVADTNSHEARQREALAELCRNLAVPMVVGYTRTDRTDGVGKRYNSVAFVDPKDGWQGTYDKVGLVPWTEFTPWEGIASQPGLRFSHGTNRPIFQLPGRAPGTSHPFAAAVCFDVAFSQPFRSYMLQDQAPEFFLICSSERSDRTGQMSRHVLNMAQVRAIECRRTLVRNVHFGRSGRIDSTGRLLDESVPEVLRTPTSLGRIPIDRRTTLYVILGEWLPGTIIGAITILGLYKGFTRNRDDRLPSSRACS